jgi:hypothetical protein
MTNKILKFLRENLPHGEEYAVDKITLSREELIGFLTGSLIERTNLYEVFPFSIKGEGEFELVLSNNVLRIDYVILNEHGIPHDYVPYACIVLE